MSATAALGSTVPGGRGQAMPLSLYEASVPVFLRGFRVLGTLLDRAEAHAAARGMDPAALIEARLAPDMYTLAGQVQCASDAAKLCAARLAGVERPSFADTEASFPELRERIARTVASLLIRLGYTWIKRRSEKWDGGRDCGRAAAISRGCACG